jgi:demethylmenaquinone methyltransferase/2-methoxy-6-polyprenyl-1,4-benzoquinol methylase
MAHRDLFDLLAPVYDRVMRPPLPQPLAQHLDLPVRGRMLDAGGGTGRISQQFLGQAGTLIVADSSLRMLSHARDKAGLRALACLAESLPFPEACFERELMVDAFHHLADQAASLRELWRVLAPGGRLVIEEPDIRHLGVRLIALGERLARMRSRFVRAEIIAQILVDLGGEVSIYRSGNNVWIITRKPASGSP